MNPNERLQNPLTALEPRYREEKLAARFSELRLLDFGVFPYTLNVLFYAEKNSHCSGCNIVDYTGVQA